MRADARMLAPRRRRDEVVLGEPRSAAGAVLALQRSAGNGAATKVVEGAARSDIDLEFPGIGDHIPVESLRVDPGQHGEVVGITITRRVDSNSPRFMRAALAGEPAPATIIVSKPGSPRYLVLRLEACMVASYSPGGETESIGLTFTRIEYER